MTREGALAAFKPIQNSAGAPCPMQRDVAAHNSAFDTLKAGNPVVYKAPCDIDRPVQPKPAPAKSEPKTSDLLPASGGRLPGGKSPRAST